MTPPVLPTDRLILRGFRESDLDRYAEQCADPEVMRYLGDGKPVGRDLAWRGMAIHLGHWQLRDYGRWAIEERATGLFLGHTGLYNPEGWPGLEIGWTLHRSAWGRGFATEAARAGLAYTFQELSAPKVISLIHPENQRSIRVAEKLGETYERTIDFQGGDTLVYAIGRDKWLADKS